ncbi:MAG TPA: hypothetical protein VH478_18380 [Trebonia sp.]|jgi:hypothetical protein|nr:hypothetical protein [Trebonia sp.]
MLLTLSSGIFRTALVIMTVALTWIIAAYDRRDYGVLRILRHLVYVATAMAALLLDWSCLAYIQTEDPAGYTAPAISAVLAASALAYLLALPASRRAAGVLLARVPVPAAGIRPPAATGRPRAGQRAVDGCVRATLGYLAAAVLADMVTAMFPAIGQPGGTVALVVAGASLLPPLAILVLALRAMAPSGPPPDHLVPQPASPPHHASGSAPGPA